MIGPDLLADAHLEFRGNTLGIDRSLQAGSKLSASLELTGTRWAVLNVAQDLVVRLNQELVAYVGIQVLANLLASPFSKSNAIHALFPSWCIRPMPYECAGSTSFSRSSLLPRLKRDITVPMGTFS